MHELPRADPDAAGKAASATFPKAKTYTDELRRAVTATDEPTLLTLADGEATTGSKLGHMASGSQAAAAAARGARRPVGVPAAGRQSVDPLLTKWNDAGTRKKTTIKLRQKVKGKATGSYRKLVLVTLSTETP